MIKVKVYSIATSGTECVLLLEELDGPRLLPIWIGISEGQAIALKFADIQLPRPMTHDLLINTLDSLGFKIDQVIVNDLRGQTFYAQLHISHNSTKHVVDSRPSDAIALAVRANCPIFVEQKVFDKCHTMKKPISEDEVKKFKEELKNIKPEDIVKGLKDKESKKHKKGEAEEATEGPEDNDEDEEEEDDE
ncbi:MAG: bifunctional nuclease family protein [Elusimicrobia bacterium]|nr:bifunctional nuclease family protein [Elusimicrobiota bacterium]